jgi:succinate dehydrogenase/fumarate reductase cytochrome b subunit
MRRPFTIIAAILFAIAALAHLYRLIRHFPIAIGQHTMSDTVSIVALIIAAIMAIGLYRESRS